MAGHKHYTEAASSDPDEILPLKEVNDWSAADLPAWVMSKRQIVFVYCLCFLACTLTLVNLARGVRRNYSKINVDDLPRPEIF